MSEIAYAIGDATQPQGSGPAIIAHVCNDIGAWGAGFVLALSRRWPEPEAAYREWYASKDAFELGNVGLVRVQPTIWVANMIAQAGVRRAGMMSLPPIRYGALATCLGKVAGYAQRLGASVHMPRIGCGLAGGRWIVVEPMIIEQLCGRGVAVTVYDLEDHP